MQAIVRDLLVNYTSRGKGKAILLLHGWGDSADTFSILQKQLSGDYHVVSVDLPGFGKSQTPNTAWGLDEYAEFTASFVKKVGIQPPYAIIGHSNGGAIATRGLGTDTLQTDKLILLASSGIRDVYKVHKKALRYLVKLGKYLTMPLPMSVKRGLRNRIYRSIGSDMLVAEHMQETFKKVITDDVQSDAKNITARTLLLYGGHDNATPTSYGETFHSLIQNSKLDVLPEAGHFIHQDAAEDVVKRVQAFLGEKS
ncbi:MAG: alpha/beta hydrolase [Candidatus Saccharibacteria bacterium]|nr:alpha/beta hydrolase [Candidatus Saccharibacteria bacterium]